MILLGDSFDRVRVGDDALQGAVEQGERLQWLTQVVTGSGKKAALALIGTIGALAGPIGQGTRGVGRFPRDDQLGLDPLAIADVANCGSDEQPSSIIDRAQADFDRKFTAVLAATMQFQPLAHGSGANVAKEGVPIGHVALAEALRQQVLDWPSDDLVVWVLKQRGDLSIGESNDARRIDQYHRIRRGFECAAGQIRRGGKQGVTAQARLAPISSSQLMLPLKSKPGK